MKTNFRKCTGKILSVAIALTALSSQAQMNLGSDLEVFGVATNNCKPFVVELAVENAKSNADTECRRLGYQGLDAIREYRTLSHVGGLSCWAGMPAAALVSARFTCH